MNRKLFCYGTLLQEDIILKLIGRVPKSIKATWIYGYKVKVIEDDGEYLQANFTNDKNDILPGQIIEVTDLEIKKINDWEGDEYRLVPIKTHHNIECEMYAKNENIC